MEHHYEISVPIYDELIHEKTSFHSEEAPHTQLNMQKKQQTPN